MDFYEIFKKIKQSLNGISHLEELVQRTPKSIDPYKILISTILSVRTKDKNTSAATDKLFTKYYTPKMIAEADLEDIEELIYVSGTYKTKAQRIKQVSQIIVEKYNGQVPKDFNELIELPGVGNKVANCVLIYAFKIPAIAVDIHVHRISNRTGWVDTKTPEQTENELKKIIPKDLWIESNGLIVKFGQQICRPTYPKCNLCPIIDICKKSFSKSFTKIKKKEIKLI
ncbi:MAG: endonuclease III [Candidatus Lokiarchaeota archaeon]|nr:endonuclease III [Candidatus Lokiarchaeota archaeon]